MSSLLLWIAFQQPCLAGLGIENEYSVMGSRDNDSGGININNPQRKSSTADSQATMISPNWSIQHRAENRIAQARAAYEESLAIHQRFAQKSERFRTELATVQQNLKRLEKP